MRLIDVDELGVGRCSRDVIPAVYCAGWNGLLGLIEKAPTVDAVPVSELRTLRDGLYENDLISMAGLRQLNALIARYEGGGADG